MFHLTADRSESLAEERAFMQYQTTKVKIIAPAVPNKPK